MLSINATENLTVSQHNAILPDDPTLDRSLAGRQELIFRKLLRRVGDVILCVLISLIASWSPLPNLSDPPTPTVGAGTKVGAETSIPGAGVGARAGAGASITGTSMGASLVGSGVSGAEADASGAGGGITSAGRGAGGVGAGAIGALAGMAASAGPGASSAGAAGIGAGPGAGMVAGVGADSSGAGESADQTNIDSSGAYGNAVPIDIPPYHGLEPNLQLSYNSSSGNGLLGVGWELSGLSTIQRASPGKGAPTYTDKDIFLLDGMELIPCAPGIESPSCKYAASPDYKAYTTKIESYQRIAFDPNRTAGGSWYVWDKTGTKYIYEARIPEPGYGAFAWDIAGVEDTLGNKITYNYWRDPAPNMGLGEIYLDSIEYGKSRVQFYYDNRPDHITYAIGHHRSAWSSEPSFVMVRKRLQSIGVEVANRTARVYELKYTSRSDTGRSFLTEVRQYGDDAVVNGIGEVINAQSISSLPPITFDAQPQSGDPWETNEVSNTEWGLPKEGDGSPSVLNGVAFTVTDPPPCAGRLWREVPSCYARLTPSNLGDVDGNGQTDWIQAAPEKHEVMVEETHYFGHEKIMITAALAGKSSNAASETVVRSSLPWIFGQTSSGRPRVLRAGYRPQSLAADVNGDNRTDLVFFIVGEPIPGEDSMKVAFYLDLAVALSQGDGTFRWAPHALTATFWETRDNTFGRDTLCSAGDVDGNGADDILCSFTKGDDKHYLGTALSQGDGTFEIMEQRALFVTGDETRPMVVGDTNGDGLSDPTFLDHPPCPTETPDCIVNYELVTALSGGNGGYVKWERTPTNWEGVDLNPDFDIADFNGDGKSDPVLLKSMAPDSTEPGAIQTAIRKPDGTWALNAHPVPSVLREVPNSFSYGDVNGDGKSDLLVMSRQEPGKPGCSTSLRGTHVNLHRVLSRGDGTFELPPSWEDCQNSREVDIAWEGVQYTPVETRAPDLNGDDTGDFLITEAKEGETSTTLYEDISPPPSGDTFHWRPAELNGDGRKDWVYIRNTPTGPRISTMLANEGGYSVERQDPFPGTAAFTALANWKVMDVNADGRDDLVYLSDLAWPNGFQVNTWFSNGDGSFHYASEPSSRIFGVAGEFYRDTPSWRPMDVNGDGMMDLVLVTVCASVCTPNPTQRENYIEALTLISRGDGTWSGRKYDQPWGRESPWQKGDTLNWRSADVNGDGSEDLVYLAYKKGDGGLYVYTLLSEGDGRWAAAPSGPFLVWDGTQAGKMLFDTLSWKLMDYNGDGKTDLVHLSPTDRRSGQATTIRVHSLLSQGDGSWWPEDSANWVGPTGTFVGDMLNWQPADVTSDERAELVHYFAKGPEVSVTTLSYATELSWRLSAPNTNTSPASSATDGVFFHLADVDGNGQDDLTRFDLQNPGMRVFSLRSRSSPDLLEKWTNSFGGATEIVYESDAIGDQEYEPSPGCHLPVGLGLHTVDMVRISDGRTSSTDQETYDYSCARWSYRERTFLGWEDVYTHRAASDNRPASTTRDRYNLSEQCLSQPTSTEIYDDQDRPIRKTITAYIPPGTTPPYECLVNHNVQEDLGSTGIWLDVRTSYAYDSFGNVTYVSEYGADGENNNDERTTAILYKPAVEPYIVGLPHQVTISDGVLPSLGKTYRYLYYCYDGDNGTDSTRCQGTITKGLLTATKLVNDNGLYNTTTYGYDDYGNLTGITDANGHNTTISYDETHHVYPEKTCNALNQCASQEWDQVIGQLEGVTDINGQSTNFSYDSLGRQIWTTLHSGALVEQKYLDWGDPQRQRIRVEVDDGSADGLWTETYLDGLARSYRSVTEGDVADKTFAQETVYADASSLIHKQSHWYATESTPVYEAFEYDGVGRLLRQTHPDGSSSLWTYDNDSTRTWMTEYDELGHNRVTYRDAYGRIAQMQETHRNENADTTYTYNAVDELETVKDAAGNVTTYTWDLRGHNRSVIDPDRGTWKYEYDPLGNLKLQSDPKGSWTKFTYDELDRLKTKRYPSGREVTWNYDEPGHGASRGRLTSIVDSADPRCLTPGVGRGVVEELHYDERGRLTSQEQCIEGLTSGLEFGYDDLDRPKTITYPDGETVTYNYDAAGRLDNMPRYVKDMEYNAAGQVTAVELANGVRETFAYDPDRDWLEESTVTQGTKTLYQASYQYYDNGLLKSSTSTTNSMNLTYTYDQNNRLKDVTGDIEQHFEYDAIGNMTYNSEVGTYSYENTGQRQGCGVLTTIECPHAVKRAGTSEFTYDDNGNLVTVEKHDPSGVKRQSIEWNADNEPYIFKDYNGIQTNVRYGAHGQRIYRSREGESTRYYGRYLDVSSQASGGPVKTTQYYFAGPLLIARKDETKNDIGTYWYHQDRLGSTRLMTDEGGAVVARYDYKPFGATASATGTVTSDIQFTGHRTDAENGLIYMNARYYDPEIARFISPDPIIPEIHNSQSLNRYSYAYNNPISNTDPTGFSPEDPSESDSVFSEFPPLLNADPAPMAPTMTFPAADVTVFSPPLAPGTPPRAKCDSCTLLGAPDLEPPIFDRGGPSMGPIDPAEAAAGRQSYETYMRVREEYPGITPEGAALVRSLQEVNWGFKWINQFYMGDLAETRQQLTRVPPGSIPLYRAVTDAELAHIQAKNSIGPSPSGLEVKYFSSTPEGASLYAKQAYSRWPQEGPYTLIRTSIPNGLIPPEMAAPYLDRGVPTITVPNAFLPQLARPEILPYMIVPPTLPP